MRIMRTDAHNEVVGGRVCWRYYAPEDINVRIEARGTRYIELDDRRRLTISVD